MSTLDCLLYGENYDVRYLEYTSSGLENLFTVPSGLQTGIITEKIT